MRSRVAKLDTDKVLVPFNKVRDYFGTKEWKILNIEGHNLISKHEDFDIKVEVEQEKVFFNVIIEAEGDPSDRLEVTTDNPTEAIVDFVAGQVPGGKETFQKYASDPTLFSQIIRRAATKIKDLGPKRTLAFVRQALLVINFDSLIEFVRTAADGLEKESRGEVEIDELARIMDGKNWDVEITEDPGTSRAAIKSNFYGFNIDITPCCVQYGVEYIIEGYPESIWWETTYDPIKSFDEWIDSDRFEKVKEERGGYEGSEPPESEPITKPITKPIKSPEEADTVPAPGG
jgi:hypothetical protein